MRMISYFSMAFSRFLMSFPRRRESMDPGSGAGMTSIQSKDDVKQSGAVRMLGGFSVMEMMIGIGLSSVIMLALAQGYRNALRVQESAGMLLSTNRRIALLFNQLERDVTTAFAPSAPVTYQKPEKKKEGEPEKPEEKPKEESAATQKPGEKPDANKEKKESVGAPFSLACFDDAQYRHRNKKWQLTKSISFVTTSPLEVFEDEQVRAVRVGYELVPDKKKSAGTTQVYQLLRKQTVELKNAQLKEKEDEKKSTLSSYVVAEYVKAFSLEATYRPKPPQAADGQKKEQQQPIDKKNEEKPEPVHTFVWGENEEKKSSTPLPEMLSLHIELWDDNLARSYSFECLLPLVVHDAEVVVEQKNEQKTPASESQPTQPVPATRGGVGGQGL